MKDPPLAGNGSAFLVKVWAFPLPRWESKTGCVGRGSFDGGIGSMFPSTWWVVACHFITFPRLGARLLGFVPPLRLPPSPVDPVLLGTLLTSALLRYGRYSARYAEALLDGFPAIFLGVETAIFPALRGRGPLPLGIELRLPVGDKLG